MEEEVHYSTVVFRHEKNKDSPKPREPRELREPKEPAATSSAPKTDGEAAVCSHFPFLLVCLGILCVLLVAAIITIIYISLLMNKQAGNLSDLTAEKQRLTTEKLILENKTEELRRQRDGLNWTLEVILKFDSFPVKDYCPGRTCQPCMKDWILYENHCYFFYSKDPPWKTWEQSRSFCKNTSADLVVIDNLQEQEFVSNHTKSYYDISHGYFIGLEKKGDEWVWIDGRNDTLRYWAIKTSGAGASRTFVLVIPGKKATESWVNVENGFENKFVCEREALIWSP
ncbi:C-type lectin domain family 12 member B-like [Archocentrus centrarchus]|uniref:C-type lectin domain family 12 member B-like n=1 Tax=Archocentrus centrarchus TaxID=63155 RepID=UPI0011E9D4EC|nr:C-type lectin domain family 12 member B-like [Archocentrus centrarchus]